MARSTLLLLPCAEALLEGAQLGRDEALCDVHQLTSQLVGVALMRRRLRSMSGRQFLGMRSSLPACAPASPAHRLLRQRQVLGSSLLDELGARVEYMHRLTPHCISSLYMHQVRCLALCRGTSTLHSSMLIDLRFWLVVVERPDQHQ